MIVRPMTEDDVEGVVELGRAMQEESDYRVLEYNTDKTREFIRSVLTSTKSIALVAVSGDKLVGMFGASCYQPYFSSDFVTSDIVFYVLPEYRGSLAFSMMIADYVEWAINKGVRQIFLQTSSGIKPETTACLYQHAGFKNVGGNYVMEVE